MIFLDDTCWTTQRLFQHVIGLIWVDTLVKFDHLEELRCPVLRFEYWICSDRVVPSPDCSDFADSIQPPGASLTNIEAHIGAEWWTLRTDLMKLPYSEGWIALMVLSHSLWWTVLELQINEIGNEIHLKLRKMVYHIVSTLQMVPERKKWWQHCSPKTQAFLYSKTAVLDCQMESPLSCPPFRCSLPVHSLKRTFCGVVVSKGKDKTLKLRVRYYFLWYSYLRHWYIWPQYWRSLFWKVQAWGPIGHNKTGFLDHNDFQ